MLSKKNNGITLVALVITIVILLILAGISISTLTNTAIFQKAKDAKQKSENAQKEEDRLISEYEKEIVKQDAEGIWDGNVNKPDLMSGMMAIKFIEPTDSTEGKDEKVSDSSKNDWYNYSEKKWANAKTNDGSMWVWIPRYAYKINKSNQTFDVVFLVGTTDNYYDKDGKLQTAKRQTSETDILDATKDYVVHPSFTNGASNNFKNGEWDKEILGYWVAKFPAGYQANTITNNNGTLSITMLNSNEEVKYSNKNYHDYDSNMTTNAISQNLSEKPKMSYPVFKPLTYAYNNISTGDAYTLSQEIKNGTSFYGLNAQRTDSHQMKNSEWGAVTYLSHSSYGRNGTEISLNNYYTSESNLWKTAITGMCTNGTSGDKSTALGNAYNTAIGVLGSTTANMAGIYDLNGCVWERTAAYISNGHPNLNSYGSSYANTTKNVDGYKTLSTKYVTVYPWNSTSDSNNNNYIVYKNLKYGYGDAILEISSSGTGTTSWNTDYSFFPRSEHPFFARGGYYQSSSNAGEFAFSDAYGSPLYYNGFRSVLVAQ